MDYVVKEIETEGDEFGPENIFEVHGDGEAVGWLVVDNTWRSPAGTGKGGTAMYLDCDLAITQKKARVMTWKQVFCVPIGEKSLYTPWGGAKGGVRGDYSKPGDKEMLCGWARALYDAGIIPEKYIFGLDVGLKEDAVREVVAALDNDPRVSMGKPTDMGGIPYDELGITGLGLLEALKPMCEHAGVEFASSKTTIAIQGFGGVGAGFMQWLGKLPREKRPRVIAISDVGGSMFCRNGFDPAQCFTIITEHHTIARYPGAEIMTAGSERFLDVDVLLLAYKEDQITHYNMHKVDAKIILQGANLGVSRVAELALHKRGVLMLPDFVVNAGASSVVYVENAGGSIATGIEYVRKVISHNARVVLSEMRSSKGKSDAREIALEIAKSEVRRAK